MSQNTFKTEYSISSWKKLHKYTPDSHENLLKHFSKMTIEQYNTNKFKDENERLNVKVKQLEEDLKRSQDKVEVLEKMVQDGVSRDQSFGSHNFVQNSGCMSQANFGDDESGELLKQHFKEVISKHNDEIKEKESKIRNLQDSLEKVCSYLEMQPKRFHSEEQVDGSERLGNNSLLGNKHMLRESIAITNPRDDLCLGQAQPTQSQANETSRFSKKRSHSVTKRLDKKDDVEQKSVIDEMGQAFMKGLEFEEKLDKIHWEVESKTFKAFKERATDQLEPNATYVREFELLEITRNNLLKALNDLRASVKEDGTKEDTEDLENIEDGGTFMNTLQSVYNASNFYCSNEQLGKDQDKK